MPSSSRGSRWLSGVTERDGGFFPGRRQRRTPPAAAPRAQAAAALPGCRARRASNTLAVGRIGVRDGRIAVLDDVLRTRDGSAEVAVISGIQAELTRSPNGEGVLSMRAALGGRPLIGRTSRWARRHLSARSGRSSLRNEDLPALFALIGSPRLPRVLGLPEQHPWSSGASGARYRRDDGIRPAEGPHACSSAP